MVNMYLFFSYVTLSSFMLQCIKIINDLLPIHTSYRFAILSYHPDKLLAINQDTAPQEESGDRFLEVQKA